MAKGLGSPQHPIGRYLIVSPYVLVTKFFTQCECRNNRLVCHQRPVFALSPQSIENQFFYRSELFDVEGTAKITYRASPLPDRVSKGLRSLALKRQASFFARGTRSERQRPTSQLSISKRISVFATLALRSSLNIG